MFPLLEDGCDTGHQGPHGWSVCHILFYVQQNTLEHTVEAHQQKR